ncbi:hypothetical protein F4779DRAFT_596855 [Xylariaceae sp. FL0662B]|nr:hypothetical protein F4779DRAFT_596855 [Xylariaceae sp. FL0662B]
MRLSTLFGHFAALICVTPTYAWPDMKKEEATWVILLNNHRNLRHAEYNDTRAYLEAVEHAAAEYGKDWIYVNNAYEIRYNHAKVFPWAQDVSDAYKKRDEGT